jgi:membrane-associated protein
LDLLTAFMDIILHLDAHLLALTHQYGVWVYAILFLIIYSETGLVIAPFLPGDSLLFVSGALCGMGALKLEWLVPLLVLAAFSGDNTNYWVGRLVGMRLLKHAGDRLIKREHIDKTHAFYERHGGKTVILARFLPIIRTFAPFVAGIGRMRFVHFVVFSVAGGVLWVLTCLSAGYLLGSRPFVKKHFEVILVAIVVISVIPAVVQFVRARRAGESSPQMDTDEHR